MYVQRNTGARSCNQCCSGEAISITYSEWVSVALGIQHTMRMCCVILSSVTCRALQRFSTLLHKDTILEKNNVFNIKCVFWFSPHRLSETFLILRRIQRYVIKNVYWSSYKVAIIFYQILRTLEFSRQILEKHSNIQFNENSFGDSGAEPCELTDGQTDKKKLTIPFRNFANQSEKWQALK